MTLIIKGLAEKELVLISAFVAMFILIAVLYLFFVRAKNVYMDDNYLYVDNFFKIAKIPVSNIKSVSQLIMYPRFIFIVFKEKSEFGKRIIFIGYTEFFLFYSTHPAVHKLKSKIKTT
ncbi:hypothetical protein GCM10011506_38010 [Marivirga lumbricoides]|uniref:DUF304 domain-containing protein n=1 Tax=Marivirga lumbricoides TaxID=1046115 RepID=A0ABQ1MXB5_9BACT|nr:hypothetical protein GCM10011506_38010 [Marivirga lumbricoides]